MGLITTTNVTTKLLCLTSANAQLTELAMKNIREDQQGFNSVYMMLNSGKVPKNKLSQLVCVVCYGLKNQLLVVVEIIENPFLSNFKKVFLFLSTLFHSRCS
jgi:DNA-directed RNA polymerase subunit beta'